MNPAIGTALISAGALIIVALIGIFAQQHSSKKVLTEVKVNVDGRLDGLNEHVARLIMVVDMLREHITQGVGAPLSEANEAAATKEAGPPPNT